MPQMRASRFSGALLEQTRTARGWNRAKLARRAEVREQQIKRWENGQNVPSADAVGQLAGALEVEIGEFYERSSDGEDEEEDSDMARAAVELERIGHADLAELLRARARHVGRRSRQRETEEVQG